MINKLEDYKDMFRSVKNCFLIVAPSVSARLASACTSSSKLLDGLCLVCSFLE